MDGDAPLTAPLRLVETLYAIAEAQAAAALSRVEYRPLNADEAAALLAVVQAWGVAESKES
jgi:hypothetical protein